jgi:putative sigma-54 modulation protein
MNIHMAFRQMDATDALKTHINEKSEKLRKFLNGQVECMWTCFVDGDRHVAELHVQGPHIDHFAQARTPDLYQSIDEVVDKVEKQLRKHKEIVKDHLHRNRASG